MVIGPSPRIWCSAGTGLRSQGCASPAPPSSIKAQALALGILEVERHPAVALDDLAVLHTLLVEAPCPPAQRLLAGNAQRRAGRCCACPAARAPTGQSKKVMSRAGRGLAVGVEEVVGADVVLVHGLLDEAHAERPRVEGVVAPGVGRDGGQMMDAGELHDRVPFLRLGLASAD